MVDYDIADRHQMVGGGAMPLLYRDVSYGLSAGVGAAGGSGLQLGYRASVAAPATSLEDLLARRQTPAAPPLVTLSQREREIRLQLADSVRDESLSLQLSVPRGRQDGATGARQGRVLDLGQPPARAGPVLNLGSRVDFSLELQLQDIYREMAISDAATVVGAADSTPLRQVLPNRTLSNGALQGRCTGAAMFPSDPLLPQGHHAAAPAPLIPSDHSAIFGQPLGAATQSGTLLVAPLPAQQYQYQQHQQQQLAAAAQHQHQRAFSDLASSSWPSMDYMDIGTDPLPAPLIGRSSSAAAEASAAVVGGATALDDARAGHGPLLRLPHQHLSQSQQSTQQQSQQQQQQMLKALTGIPDGASGDGIVTFEHDNSLVAGASFGSENALSALRTAILGASMPGGGAGTAAADFCDDGAVVSLPEAGDGNATSWCGADDIDAALDMLMEEAGSGAVYQTSNDSASLERVCFKLHNLHPRDLPSDLMCAMGSWLAAARAEVVQGALRPGCTQLILDIYTTGPNPADIDLETDEASSAAGGGGTSVSVGFPFLPPRPPQDEQSSPLSRPTSPSEVAQLYSKTSAPDRTTFNARVLGGLMPSEIELASLDAAASAAGAEALEPFVEPGCASWTPTHDGNDRFPGDGGNVCTESSSVTDLSAYVMHNGNVRAAAACFKKLLGPRAVQSMSVSINHEVLSISSHAKGHYVADVRGTFAGLDTPLLLSVSPLAVLAGEPAEVNVIGSHLAGPGRRPQVRCQGAHVACSVVAAPAGGSGVDGSGSSGRGAFQPFRAYDDPILMDKLVEHTLPGSHRSEAVTQCTTVDLHLEVPDTPGLLILEWEVERSSGGFGISEHLLFLAVPDPSMAVDINKLSTKKGGNDSRLRGFLQDLGLVLDYVTRVNQCVLLPMSVLMSTEQEAAAAYGDGVAVEAADLGLKSGGGDGGSSSMAAGSGASCSNPDQAAIESGFELWQNRSRGGGADQRGVQTTCRVLDGGTEDNIKLEHDSRAELMGRPRLSKKHYGRVAALTPSLLAFAADSGMPAVMSWLMDFMLEHIYFGDLAAVFQCVEAVGGSSDLPLLHRAVRSGNTGVVRLLLHRAASHGLACNLAQPAGLYNITPLHLAALQPVQSGMLQACGCTDPRVVQLWTTVPDAAGRTPAMYLRRQLDRSALIGPNPATATALLHAAAAAAVAASAAGPVHPRSSMSGSTTGTACPSWGSEETTDPIVMGGAGISMGAAGVRVPIGIEEDCSGPAPRAPAASDAVSHGCDGGRMSGMVGWRESASGDGNDDGEGTCRGRRGQPSADIVDGYPHSQETFRVGGRVAGEKGGPVGLGAEAAVLPPQSPSPPSGEAVVASGEAARVTRSAGSEEINVRVPLQNTEPLAELRETVLLRQLRMKAVKLQAASPAALATASASASGLCSGGYEICTKSGEAERLLSRMEVVGSTASRDSGFVGDSTEDWPGLKSELRTRRKHEREQVQPAAEADTLNVGQEGACVGASARAGGVGGGEGSTVLGGQGERGWGVPSGVKAAAADSGFPPRPVMIVTWIALMAVLLVLWSTRIFDRVALSHQ
ncbi:hypothetical protein Vretimale_3985 [Volvox reticuliferus]|nr:hypothetical protein Vretimale_3985 [Volvox reticuliferus]